MKVKCLTAVLILNGLFVIDNQSYACHLYPVADLRVIPQSTNVGRRITFDGSGSYDPDGPPGIGGGLVNGIKRFEWDFSYDVSEGFNCDYYETASHHDGAFDGIATRPYYTVGTYKVMLKVIDNDAAEGGTVDKSDTITRTVIVYIPDIVFAVGDVGDGMVKISYTTNHNALLRSIALSVVLGDGTIENGEDVVSRALEYNCFMDYAHSNPDPGYQLGTGHPLAKPDAPGVPIFGNGISVFSINMACFDNNGHQAPGPASANPLITLQLHQGTSAYTVVTVSEDTLRSSFADYGLSTNLPQTATISWPPPR